MYVHFLTLNWCQINTYVCILQIGIPDLFQTVVYLAVMKNEQNIQDTHGNSALHLVVDHRTKCINNDLQVFVLQELLKAGVNPLLLNKKKKRASKCAPKALPHLGKLLMEHGTWHLTDTLFKVT
jgi:hypothetical protein